MERRDFLRQTGAVGTLGAVGLAGCLADADDDASDSPDDSPGDTPGSDPEAVTVVDSAVEVTDTGCSSGEHSTATVSIEPNAPAVSFSGHLQTPTPCYGVSVSRTTYSQDDDLLTVDLGAEEEDGECVECEGRVDFEGSVDLAGGVPSRVVVTHDDAIIADTDNEDGTTPPEVVDSSIDLTDSGCASGEGSTASVAMHEEDTTVTFTGQVTTSDPCYTVTLEEVDYDPDLDRLAIIVGAEPQAEDGTCMECLGLVEFEGVVDMDGGLPGEAYVAHDDTILTGSGDESGAEDEDDSGSDEPGAVELVEQSFTVTGTSNGIGSGDGTADIEFDSEADTVVVTGTIIGNNGCATAELGGASYDPDEDTLSVDVVTTAREGTEGQSCTQALVGIDYEATFAFAGGVAHSASVSHDGRGVASAAFDSATASAPEEG